MAKHKSTKPPVLSFQVGDKVKVVLPCGTSGNRKNKIGKITKIENGMLDGFIGPHDIYQISNKWWEHESGLELIKPTK